jgi:hypothetical protein|tara:strand:+ start:2661 stop:2960 length:300 start_codon:yes stop_codon:yes gene_type:complete
MLIKLTEVCVNGTYSTSQNYLLKEVFINPDHVIMIREEARIKQLNEQGQVHKDLNPSHEFSKLTINRGNTGTEIVVVGGPSHIETKLNKLHPKKQLLNG